MSNELTVRPKSTGTDQNPYEALEDPRHKVAVDLRVEGYRLRYIAEHFKLTEQPVKDWFYHAGPCHAAYVYKKAEWQKETEQLFRTSVRSSRTALLMPS